MSIQQCSRYAIRKASVLLLLSFLAFGSASAQELRTGITLPGSLNATFGTTGPLEPGNAIGSATVEQGFTAWRRGPVFVVGFVDVTLRADTLGYAWNNTMPLVAGGKVVVSGPRGVFHAAVGVNGDGRKRPTSRVTAAAMLSYWAGWQRSRSQLQLPGSVWASSGFATASEPGNWITTAHLEQGVAAWRRHHLALVPFAGTTVGVDTDNRPWNNRGFVDAGVKVATRLGTVAVDFGVAERVTRTWSTGATAAAPVVFVNVWAGWMPHVSR